MGERPAVHLRAVRPKHECVEQHEFKRILRLCGVEHSLSVGAEGVVSSWSKRSLVFVGSLVQAPLAAAAPAWLL